MKYVYAQVLRYERNEYGKSIRKEYEAGNIKEKKGICELQFPELMGYLIR